MCVCVCVTIISMAIDLLQGVHDHFDSHVLMKGNNKRFCAALPTRSNIADSIISLRMRAYHSMEIVDVPVSRRALYGVMGILLWPANGVGGTLPLPCVSTTNPDDGWVVGLGEVGMAVCVHELTDYVYLVSSVTRVVVVEIREMISV